MSWEYSQHFFSHHVLFTISCEESGFFPFLHLQWHWPLSGYPGLCRDLTLQYTYPQKAKSWLPLRHEMNMCSDFVLVNQCRNQTNVTASFKRRTDSLMDQGYWHECTNGSKTVSLTRVGLEGGMGVHQTASGQDRIYTPVYKNDFALLSLSYNLQTCEVLPIKPESDSSECCLLESRQCLVFHWSTAFFSATAWPHCGWLWPPHQIKCPEMLLSSLDSPPPTFPWLPLIDSL